MWVSTQAFQLGKYSCYDLNKVFVGAAARKGKREITETDKTIPADSFLFSQQYAKYLFFNKVKNYIHICTKSELVSASE